MGSSLSAWWLLAVALAACCVWGALDRLARHDRGRLLPLLLALLATAGGATVFFAGSATTGALAGPIVALLGGLFAVALWRPQRGLLRPVIPSVALLLVGQWTVGRFYTNDMALVSLTLLIGSPLLLALALPWIGRTRQALAAALQIALLALTTSVATGVAAFSYFTPVAAPQASGAAKRGASATSQPRNDDDYGY